jgi:pimeloyl-ACP methyl ester carboxylesterase
MVCLTTCGTVCRSVERARAPYESLLPLLPRLDMPALLITGGQDPTTSPEPRDAFQHTSSRHTIEEFEQAGYFVHADDPGPYARLVIDFVRSSTQR